jgi:hypothetical protein
MNQIEALIDKIAAEYGVPGWVARAVAYGENSGFDPSLIAPDPTPSMPNAVSVGLFQIHDVNTPDRAKRQNAEWNIRWAMQNSVGPAYKDAVAKGITDPAQLLTYIWTNGQRAAASAIPGGVQRAMGYLQGTPTAATGQGTTQGEVAMAGTKKLKYTDWLVEEGLVTEGGEPVLNPTTGEQLYGSDGKPIVSEGGELKPGLTNAAVSAMWQAYLEGGTDTGTATTTTTIPSAQETATGQFDMEMALNDAVLDWNKFGADVATQNFVNKLSAAQEGRLEATAAQEYARNLAPAGMTELKLAGWGEGIPLGAPVPNTYSGAMELANVPQAPEIPMPQQPTMPQMPNLGALPSQQTSTQIQTPYQQPSAALPTGGGSSVLNSPFMQAIRNVMQRIGAMPGVSSNLPPGG